jgi:hypothetical protein
MATEHEPPAPSAAPSEHDEHDEPSADNPVADTSVAEAAEPPAMAQIINNTGGDDGAPTG